MEKPKNVSLAVNLSWASLAIGPVKMMLDPTGPAHQTSFMQAALIVIITLALIAFLILKFSAGKNWARITLLVFFFLGMAPAFFILPAEFNRSAIVGILSIAEGILQGYALFLAFTKPGSEWFRKDKSTV